MKYHFDENRIEKKIKIRPKKEDDISHWNSFSCAPDGGEYTIRQGKLYGTVNRKLDSIEIRL